MIANLIHRAFAASWSQRRRRARLLRLFALAMRGSGEAKWLTHVVWLFCAGLLGLVLRAPELGWLVAPALVLFFALVATALYDAVYLVIPARMLWTMALCGASLLIPLDPPEALTRIAAGIGGLVFLRLVAMSYAYFRGRPGLGDGDAKLFGAAGLILGPSGLPVCLLVAVASALASLAVEARSGAVLTRDFILPFGAHLALGLWLTFTFGPIDWGLG